jgi:tRNA(Ile)-lysidine synthase
LRKGIESVKGNLRGISLTQLDRILGIIKGPSGLEIHLPQGVVTRHSYGNLIISGKGRGKRRGPGCRLAFKGARLEVPGETEIKELNLRVRSSLLPRKNIRLPGRGSLPEKDTAYFDFDKISFPLRIRLRKRGDIFHPLGMKGRKKLKDFFMDRKVPREERDEVTLLVRGENILWVIGHRQGEEAKVTDETKKVLRIRILRTQKTEDRGQKTEKI